MTCYWFQSCAPSCAPEDLWTYPDCLCTHPEDLWTYSLDHPLDHSCSPEDLWTYPDCLCTHPEDLWTYSLDHPLDHPCSPKDLRTYSLITLIFKICFFGCNKIGLDKNRLVTRAMLQEVVGESSIGGSSTQHPSGARVCDILLYPRVLMPRSAKCLICTEKNQPEICMASYVRSGCGRHHGRDDWGI